MSEVRPVNDIPDEVKKQMVDGKPRVVTENLPPKSKEDFAEWTAKRQKLLQELLNVTMEATKLQKTQQEIYDKIQTASAGIQKILQEASRKLRIDKRTDYNWQFKGDSFVGILREQPKKEN